MRNNYNYQIDNKMTINCVKCLKKLRVPLDKGKILVTCPVCKKEFVFNPDSVIHTLKQIFISFIAWLLSAKTKFPFFKARLKAYYVKNKRNSIILAILIIIILAALIMSFFIKPVNKIDTPVKPESTAISLSANRC